MDLSPALMTCVDASEPVWCWNAEVDWLDVWAAVFPDDVISTGLLPYRAVCPLCHAEGRSFWIVRDSLLGGQRFWCANCHESGDMLQFAAAVWKRSLPAAIAGLKAAGVSGLPGRGTELTDYVQLLDEQQRMFRLMENPLATASVRDSPAAKLFLSKIAGISGYPQTRTQQVLQGFSVVNHREVEKAFNPLSVLWSSAGGDGVLTNGSHSRLFRGRAWDDVLLMPCFDVPGRIGSFYCLGRDHDAVQAIVHYRIHGDQKGIRRLGSVGLQYHPEAATATGWGQQYLVYPDMLTAARQQYRHLINTPKALPLVGMPLHPKYPVRDDAWQAFYEARPVFVVREWSSAWLATVIARNGNVAWLRGSRLDEVPGSPTEQVDRFLSSAVHWSVALNEWLRLASQQDLDNLLMPLSLESINVPQVLSMLSIENRARVQELLKTRQVRGTVSVDRQMIEATEQGWFLASNRREQICGANLQINRVLCTEGQHYYQGSIFFQGTAYAFSCEKKVFDKNPFSWMERYLLQSGAGLMLYNPRWSSKAVLIAQKLHPPEVLQSVAGVGWNAKSQKFIFPRFHLGTDGQAETVPVDVYPDEAPGRDLHVEISLQNPSLGVLQPAFQTAWGAISAILADVLAPIVGDTPKGARIHGPGARKTLELIRQLCGNRLHRALMTPGRSRGVAKHILQQLEQHSWPLFVYAPSQQLSERWQLWERRESSGWLNCSSDMLSTIAAGLEDTRWAVLVAKDTGSLSREQEFLLRGFLPGLLTTVLQRARDIPKDAWPRRIWLRRLLQTTLHENPDLVHEHTPVDLWTQLLKDLLRRGALKIGRSEFHTGNADIWLEAEHVRISKSSISRQFEQAGCVPPNWQYVDELLTAEQIVERIEPDNWVLPLNWLQGQNLTP